MSESFVDEASEGLVLLRLAALEVESEPDAEDEDRRIDRTQPLDQAGGAGDEADVLEQQDQHDRLADERDDRGQHSAPPVNFGPVVLPEVTQDRNRDERLNREDHDHAHDCHESVQVHVSLLGWIVTTGEDSERDDDERRDHGLDDGSDVGALVLGSGLTERGWEYPLPTQ